MSEKTLARAPKAKPIEARKWDKRFVRGGCRSPEPKPPLPEDICPRCGYSPLGVYRKHCPACLIPNARHRQNRNTKD